MLRLLLAALVGSLGLGQGSPPGVMPLQPPTNRAPVPAIQRLGYEALPCRGTCPTFSVIFHADGTFTYEGRANVPRLGPGSGTVPLYLLQQIMRYVAEIDFANLDDVYPSPLLDVNTTYTMVDWGDATKVVQNEGNSAPAIVWALERLLNDMLAQASWD